MGGGGNRKGLFVGMSAKTSTARYLSALVRGTHFAICRLIGQVIRDVSTTHTGFFLLSMRYICGERTETSFTISSLLNKVPVQ